MLTTHLWDIERGHNDLIPRDMKKDLQETLYTLYLTFIDASIHTERMEPPTSPACVSDPHEGWKRMRIFEDRWLSLQRAS